MNMADRYCYTDVKIEKITFFWVIRHFEFVAGNYLESPRFSGSEDPNIEWTLKLQPYGDNFMLKLSLQPSTSESRYLMTKYKFALLNGVNEEKYSKESEVESLHLDSYTYRVSSGRFNDFISKSTLSHRKDELLSDGTLRIHCTLSVKGEVVHTKGTYDLPTCDLGIQLGSALREESFADFTLAVGDKELKAHKVVLAARSPVFKGMIESHMQENRENRVEITDFDPEVVQELLTYIYTGEAPNLKKLPRDLLRIADKYDLQRLKIMCGEVLYHSLNVSNVADTLLLADLHSVQQLKSACLSFTAAHISKVEETTGWGTLKTCNRELYIEVLEALQSTPPLKKKPRHF